MKSGTAKSVISLQELLKEKNPISFMKGWRKPLENIPMLISPPEEQPPFLDNISLSSLLQLPAGSFRN
jgi:hypothetical protein